MTDGESVWEVAAGKLGLVLQVFLKQRKKYIIGSIDTVSDSIQCKH